MNILYVVNADIEKPAFGNAQRTRLVYDALCKLGNVYILDIRERGESWKGRKFLRLLPQTGFKRVVNSIWHRLLIKPWNCLVPVYPFSPRWSTDEYFPNVKFDVVVSRYLFHVGVMALWKIAPRVYVDIDDFPMQVFDTIYASKLGIVKRSIARKVNYYFVRYALHRLSGCWVANPEQYSIVAQECRSLMLKNIPFGAETMRCGTSRARDAAASAEPFVFTVGLMSYPPNYKGIDSFLKNVWPHVCSRIPNVRYKIVGKGAPEDLQVAWSKIPRVDVLGYVEDLSELYRDCIATVVPVSEGGGTCIKTLESLANSRVCISTAFGARGIPKEILAGGKNGIFIYDNPLTFGEVLANLLNNGVERKECECRGKAYIDNNYSSRIFEQNVFDLLASCS